MHLGDTMVEAGRLEIMKSGQIGTAESRTNRLRVTGGSVVGEGKVYSNEPATWQNGSKLKASQINPLPGPGGVGVEKAGVMEIVGGLLMEPGSIMEYEIDGTTPGSGAGYHSQLIVGGSIELDQAILSLNLTSAPPPLSPGHRTHYVLIDNDDGDTIGGYFMGLPEASVLSLTAPNDPTPYYFQISYTGGGTGNDVVLSHVPEPASALLLAVGLVLSGRRFRR